MAKIKVRVYINGSAPMVVDGFTDGPMGAYILLRPASGSGYEAIPELRLHPKPGQIRPLPPGSDADVEFLEPVPSHKL